MRTYDSFCKRCGKVINHEEQGQIESLLEVENCPECGTQMLIIFPSPQDFFMCRHHHIKLETGGFCNLPSKYDPSERCGLPLNPVHESWVPAVCEECGIEYRYELYEENQSCIKCGKELTDISDDKKFPNFYFKKMPQGWRLSASQRKELWKSDDINDFRRIG